MFTKVSKSLIAASLFATSTAFAVPFSNVAIGDIDGFGYDADANFNSLSGDGGTADRDNDGHLGANDVLPSLNGNQVVATGNGDDFDNRLNEGYSCTGCTTNTGMAGVEYTDIALSTSYTNSSNNNKVYDANTSTYGAGGTFPAGNSASLPNQPGFAFDFFVASGDIVAGTTVYFNMLFADYDVTPANIYFEYGDGSSENKAISAQNNGPDDGLIQAAYAALDFYDVFTWNAGTNGWDGFLIVDFVANNEPYTAFDFVELSVKPITVPEPGTIALFLSGIAGFAFARRKKA